MFTDKLDIIFCKMHVHLLLFFLLGYSFLLQICGNSFIFVGYICVNYLFYASTMPFYSFHEQKSPNRSSAVSFPFGVCVSCLRVLCLPQGCDDIFLVNFWKLYSFPFPFRSVVCLELNFAFHLCR